LNIKLQTSNFKLQTSNTKHKTRGNACTPLRIYDRNNITTQPRNHIKRTLNKTNLISLINQGESETLEFKSSFSKAVIETIVAFSNTKGGKAIFEN